MLTWLSGLWRALLRTWPFTNEKARPAHVPSALERLPQEVLDEIFGYLELSAVACLAICSKPLHHNLSTKHVLLLKSSGGHADQRKALLMHLARDQTTLFYCYVCSTNHHVSKVRSAFSPGYLGRTPCLKTSFAADESFQSYMSYSAYAITFPHVQLAMHQYRHGNSEFLDRLFQTEVRRPLANVNVWTLLCVEPRVVKDMLFLRVQHWIAADEDYCFAATQSQWPSICCHIDHEPSFKAWSEVKHQTRQTENAVRQCSNLDTTSYWCSVCNAEIQYTTTCLTEGKVAWITTKWLNFGSGNSPEQYQWLLQVRPRRRGHLVRQPKYDISIRSLYENTCDSGRTQSAAHSENANLLRNSLVRRRRFQQVLDHQGVAT